MPDERSEAIGALQVIALRPENIPAALTSVKRWVVWTAGKPKSNGKFAKVPVSPVTGKSVNGNDPDNWMSFAEAVAAHEAGHGDGIGIVLTGEPIAVVDGMPRFLVALDFDNCEETANDIKPLWLRLGKPYLEVSPSGKGLRMFALTRVSIKGGNAGPGREMYGSGRFMTVTGVGGKGQLIDATDALLKLQDEWFPPKPAVSSAGVSLLGRAPANSSRPASPESLARVKAQLSFIPADCNYERWRDIVWAILSTGWPQAEGIAREWSMTAPHRYDERVFDQLLRSFNPHRGITLGTLVHYAREAGWEAESRAQRTTSVALVENGPRGASRLLTVDELRKMPLTKWRVQNVLPERGLATIYGQSGSGKTFLALDLACAIATGNQQWFGSKVRAAPVVYVGLEGEGGIRQRVTAWELENKTELPDEFRVVLGNFTLKNPAEAGELAADILSAVGEGCVVVIDTLNQATPGADENSSKDMGEAIANVKALASAINGLVILVHHAGKNPERGMRGHSSLYAAMDSVIEVSSTPNGRVWKMAKSKDGESGFSRGFTLSPHVVGQDEDGADITSCVVRQGLLPAAAAAKPVTGKNQKAALDVLAKLLEVHPDGIPMKDAISAVAAVMACEPGRKAARAAETITRLTENGHLQLDDGGVLLS